MELSCGDDLRQLLHVCRFDIHDVEALVLDIEVPEIDSQVVTADESLPIAVDRYAVDVVGVGIGVGSTRHCRNNSVVVRQAGELQIGCILELGSRGRTWRAATAGDVGGCDILGEVVLCNHLKGFLENFPKLDCLIVGGQKVVGGILAAAPLDFVDLLLDLQRLQVVELGLMGLEFGVEFVFARLLLHRGQADEFRPSLRGLSPHTVSLRSKRTTRPPLSPVAR